MHVAVETTSPRSQHLGGVWRYTESLIGLKGTSVSNLLFTRFVPPRLRRLHGPIKRDLAATFRTPEAMLSVVPDASLRPTFNRRGLSRAGSEVPDRSRA
jgi:hypothetical protein